MKIREATEAALSGRDVEPALLEAAFGEMMDGEARPVQIAGLLVALRAKGESVGEIVAAARALRARASTIPCSDPNTIDTCGTGGSGLDTFNISTTSAFVVAGAGARVAKHGNRAATSRSGSFDVLEALGVEIGLPIEACGAVLDEVGIGMFFARTAHPAFRFVAPVRQELGIRTLMNCLGPLLNPAGAPHQIVGVYTSALVDPLARALEGLGARRALVVHGCDGMDEITTTGPSRACMVGDGEPRSFEIEPEELGIARAGSSDLRGADPDTNAKILREILAGEEGPRRDIVLLNAGAALWVVGVAESHAEGIERARESIDSGAAEAKLAALVRATQARAQECTPAGTPTRARS